MPAPSYILTTTVAELPTLNLPPILQAEFAELTDPETTHYASKSFFANNVYNGGDFYYIDDENSPTDLARCYAEFLADALDPPHGTTTAAFIARNGEAITAIIFYLA